MDNKYKEVLSDRAKKLYREYDKHSDEGLNNLRKNMRADRVSTNEYFEKHLPVDELATMGSDTRIHKDYSKMTPEFKKKWEGALEEISEKRKMAETHLKERGYVEEYMKKTKNNPDGYKTKFVNKTLGKTLKSLGIIGSALGAASYSDAAGAAVDAATSAVGGVEEMGVSDEQKYLDKKYKDTIKQRALRQK